MSKNPEQNNDNKDWAAKIEDETDVAKPEEQGTIEPDDTGLLSHPEYAEVVEKLTAAEQQVDDLKDKLYRAHADLTNSQDRNARDMEKARKFALSGFVKDLLPVVDSLERGIEQIPEDQDKAQEGLKLTLEKMLQVMDSFGVEQVNPVGEAFNPELHEAMTAQVNNEVEPNTVLIVMQKGYTLNKRLVRPALVAVSKKG